MLLAIDVGNTQTAVGVFSGADLACHWRLSTAPDRTRDEYRVWLSGMLELEGLGPPDLTGVAISSVVPLATAALREVGPQLASGPTVVVEPGIRTGIPILMDNPAEVGADRVVNSVAALDRYGAPVIVVDFGTATTFDVVGDGGGYIGGVIAPGLEVSLDALIASTAALRRVELKSPKAPLGKNTVEAIQSGLIYGYAGLVDGILERLTGGDGPAPKVVSTGGLASTIVPHCHRVSEVDDHLTLNGLRLIYDLQGS